MFPINSTITIIINYYYYLYKYNYYLVLQLLYISIFTVLLLGTVTCDRPDPPPVVTLGVSNEAMAYINLSINVIHVIGIGMEL